jgi:two-component system, NtrC family, nitrogen regulation response regulator GlnG
MHVVIVDDDLGTLSTLQNGFIDAGHDVVTFGGFEKAKRYLAANIPDVLVTDVRLGAFNGLQLVLLAKIGHPEMAAFVLSRDEDCVLRKDAASVGACFHVKPIETAQLLTELKKTHRTSVHA